VEACCKQDKRAYLKYCIIGVGDPEPFVPDPETIFEGSGTICGIDPALFHLIFEKEKEEVLSVVPFFSLYD
jgi:hypothetical protein